MKKKQDAKVQLSVAYIFIIIMVVVAMVPFIYVVLTALKTQDQIYDPNQIIPTRITLENFRNVLFESNFVRYF